MKIKLSSEYLCINSFEESFLGLICVQKKSSLNFFIISSQRFSAISKYRKSRGGICRRGDPDNYLFFLDFMFGKSLQKPGTKLNTDVTVPSGRGQKQNFGLDLEDTEIYNDHANKQI